MPPITEVTIILTEAQAEEFKLFQKHFPTFKLLLERGVFDQHSAAVTLHFDINGTLQLIQRADSLYSRKHELT
jgi:hypothetical protein